MKRGSHEIKTGANTHKSEDKEILLVGSGPMFTDGRQFERSQSAPSPLKVPKRQRCRRIPPTRNETCAFGGGFEVSECSLLFIQNLIFLHVQRNCAHTIIKMTISQGTSEISPREINIRCTDEDSPGLTTLLHHLQESRNVKWIFSKDVSGTSDPNLTLQD
jgi:hypothetical protein